MVKHIHSTPLGTPKTPASTEHFANLKSPDATDSQAVQKMLVLFNYLYKIPLAPVAELSTKDVCVICKGDTDIGFPMCETARSRVRLANCGHILCLGCLSRSAFSSRGNRCPHCQEKLVQDGQETCCEDDDTVNLVRLVEYLKGIGPETARVASKDIFATCHNASSRNSRKSVINGAYWVAVAGDVAGGGVDRANFRSMIWYAIYCTAAVLCISLALLGLMVPFSNGNYSLTILVLLMYVIGIRLSFVALNVLSFLSLRH